MSDRDSPEQVSESQININYNQNESGQGYVETTKKIDSESENDCHIARLEDTHRKVNHRCLNNLGPPPRPFKKARFAWEIKNYDYTMKQMNQNARRNEEQQRDAATLGEVSAEKNNEYNIQDNFSSQMDHVIYDTRLMQGVNNQEANMLAAPCSHPGYVGSLLPVGYQTQFGPVLGQDEVPRHLVHGCMQNNIPAQFPPDPDAKLIRWHTRQLCRSIFDNTVNRMLENMGFSPVTEQTQGLHPLLVLSLSDDEERDSEEINQRALETQALSAALHQKGLFPAPYHYDPLESATTSDYDSSEEESDLGDGGGQEDLSSEVSPPTQNSAYLNFHSQHPSLAHLVGRPISCMPAYPSVYPSITNQDTTVNSCHGLCTAAHIRCDASDPSLEQVTTHAIQQENLTEGHIEDYQLKYHSRYKSLQCADEQNRQVDDNENCLAEPNQETIIEGKVEGLLDHQNSGINFKDKSSETDNGNDKYFIRNAIEMAINQQGLGYPKA